MTRANASTVAGPMSSPIRSSGISRALTVVGGTSSAGSAAATTSVGSSIRTPAASAVRWMLRTSSIRSSSTRERPTDAPSAASKVNAMAPPIRMRSTRWINASITPSLSETFAPPRTATNGRSGPSSNLPRMSTSFWRSRPATAGRPLASISSGRATTEACARCAAPNASFTYASASSASAPAKRRIVRFLARIEPQVLEHRDSPRPRRPTASIVSGSSGMPSARTGARPASSPVRASATTRMRSSSFGVPFGRPRCAASTSAALPLAEPSIVGSEARDPAVVGDRAVVGAAR